MNSTRVLFHCRGPPINKVQIFQPKNKANPSRHNICSKFQTVISKQSRCPPQAKSGGLWNLILIRGHISIHSSTGARGRVLRARDRRKLRHGWQDPCVFLTITCVIQGGRGGQRKRKRKRKTSMAQLIFRGNGSLSFTLPSGFCLLSLAGQAKHMQPGPS